MYQVWKYKLDHVAFWIITFGFYAFTRWHVAETSGWVIYIADVVTRNVLIAIVCYTNVYLLFERFFKSRQYLLYGLTLLALLIAYTLAQDAADMWINQSNSFLSRSYYHFSIGLFYAAFTLALELSKRWYRQELLLHKMESEKLQTELEYLKAQLNPHFLFNCLNTIYFQIDQDNFEARESLRKFSEMLRYQLYECNEEKISIEKETSYLESYVDLQRLRKSTNSVITLNKQQTLESFRIPPLLLLPFVENAFKHLSNFSEVENRIDITLSRDNGTFQFSATNTIDDGLQHNPDGIGLKNVKRRLELLYPNRHTLEIKKTDDRFLINLQLTV
jgi:two-component system LytT family sensor kinase